MLSEFFGLQTGKVTIEGSYVLMANSGVVLYIFCTDAEKPTATIGNGTPVEIAWFGDKGVCPAFDTYMVANCTLHTKHSTEISIVHLIPIKHV